MPTDCSAENTIENLDFPLFFLALFSFLCGISVSGQAALVLILQLSKSWLAVLRPKNQDERMRNQGLFRVALGLMFCALCGCATHSKNSSAAAQYLVTAQFDFPFLTLKPTQKIEITTRSGIPFAVKARDTSSNLYEVSGTIWKKSEHRVHLEGLIISSYYPGCGSLGTGGPASSDAELGEDLGVQAIMGPGYSFVVTKK